MITDSQIHAVYKPQRQYDELRYTTGSLGMYVDYSVKGCSEAQLHFHGDCTRTDFGYPLNAHNLDKLQEIIADIREKLNL